MLTNFQSKYKIQCKIGEGSFSEVLKCQNRESSQLLAAKRLKKTFQHVAEAAEIPEVIAMKKLPQHPNILHLIESHYEPIIGKVTLIFDLMDMSIYDMMKNRKRPLPESRVKNYLYQILKGICHLHNHGLFHRDVKPENILIKGELVKIADLGSVRGIYSKRPYTEYISTRWYRSPECLLTAGYYGPKMDVWAIGCVFYELLTLKPLFPGSNEIDQIAKIHTIIGSPSTTVISRFKKQSVFKSQHADISFPLKPGTGFGSLLQNVSANGKDILKMMLIYDPKNRAATRRLLENRYFNDLRENELLKRRISASSTSTGSSATEWRNPVLLSFITSERKRKQKQIVMQSKVARPIHPVTKTTLPNKSVFKASNIGSLNHNKVPIIKSVSKIESKTKLIQDQRKRCLEYSNGIYVSGDLLTHLQLEKTPTEDRRGKTTSRDIQKMRPMFRSEQVLKETTNLVRVSTGCTVSSSFGQPGNSGKIQPNAFTTASTSFLPMLVSKNMSVNSNMFHKSTNILRGQNTQRHLSHKPFLPTSSKPRLEPIMEHISSKYCGNHKLPKSIHELTN